MEFEKFCSDLSRVCVMRKLAELPLTDPSRCSRYLSKYFEGKENSVIALLLNSKGMLISHAVIVRGIRPDADRIASLARKVYLLPKAKKVIVATNYSLSKGLVEEYSAANKVYSVFQEKGVPLVEYVVVDGADTYRLIESSRNKAKELLGKSSNKRAQRLKKQIKENKG